MISGPFLIGNLVGVGCRMMVLGPRLGTLVGTLESVERSEWKSVGGGKRERTRYSRYAKATFRKDRRLNIRLSSKDLEAIQKRALAEGLPYQTLIASLLHKYASGRLKEI
jgi:predicted DNA binding CopG/RHH family protein